jgi:hypothetical protein
MPARQPIAIVNSRHALNACDPRGVGEETVADETHRWLYLVEHDLRGLSPAQLASVDRALDEAVRREAGRGSRIRYVQRIYAPDERRCLCLFEATSPQVVRAVNDMAQFPLARVVAVLSSVPDGTSLMADLEETP